MARDLFRKGASWPTSLVSSKCPSLGTSTFDKTTNGGPGRANNLFGQLNKPALLEFSRHPHIWRIFGGINRPVDRILLQADRVDSRMCLRKAVTAGARSDLRKAIASFDCSVISVSGRYTMSGICTC